MSVNGGLIQTWIASSEKTTLTGTNWGSNLFELAPGGDTVILNSTSGNTVDFGYGDGAVTVDAKNNDSWWDSGGTGSILLGSGITDDDLSFQTDKAGDLIVSLLGDNGSLTGDSIMITNYFVGTSNPWSGAPVVSSLYYNFQFTDGTSVNFDASTTNTLLGSTDNTILMGTDWLSNIFDLAPGGDQVTFGFGAPNTVEFGYGDGQTTINANGGLGTIQMAAGITAADVIFESDAAGDLTISLLDSNGVLTGDEVIVEDDYFSNADYFNNIQQSYLKTVVFANGASIAIAGNITDTWIGSSSNTTLIGSGYAPNLFDLGPGGDQVTFGNGAFGGADQNTVDFGYGDGASTIDPNGGNGYIQLGSGITQGDVTYTTDAGGDLTISLLDSNGLATGDSIIVPGDFASGTASGELDTLKYADGSEEIVNANSWTLAIGYAPYWVSWWWEQWIPEGVLTISSAGTDGVQQIITTTNLGEVILGGSASSPITGTLVLAGLATIAIEAGAELGAGSFSNYDSVSVIGDIGINLNMEGNYADFESNRGGSTVDFYDNGTATITNFGLGDSIFLDQSDLLSPTDGLGIELSYNTATGTLIVEETDGPGGSIVGSIALAVSGAAGDYLNSSVFSYSIIANGVAIGLISNETITAGQGSNTLVASGLVDVINGDGGTDTIDYGETSGTVTINEHNPSGPEQSAITFGSYFYSYNLNVSQDENGDIILALPSPESFIYNTR
jgi:hypothetical protein